MPNLVLQSQKKKIIMALLHLKCVLYYVKINKNHNYRKPCVQKIVRSNYWKTIHKLFQKQIGHQAVETKIIQNCNKTNSDLCLRNMGIERSHNSEIISL